jgi:CheY-like chemotaxis protein
MPKLDGYQATKKIREMGSNSDICKIIALTANVTHEDREKCLSIGMDDFIAKPMHSKDLKEVIRRNFQSIELKEDRRKAS